MNIVEYLENAALEDVMADDNCAGLRSTTEIAKAFDVTPQRARYYLNKAVQDGKILCFGAGIKVWRIREKHHG